MKLMIRGIVLLLSLTCIFACDHLDHKTKSEAVQMGTASSDRLESLQKNAEAGDADAQHTLAVMYENGDGVPQNVDAAAVWYQKAAEQGLAEAQFRLGQLYFYGEGGVTKDVAGAVRWWQKAAEQGQIDAQFNLALSYTGGVGVPKDSATAVVWFQRAAEQGHAKAMFCLALMYGNGDGVPKNIVKAVEWYQKAAEQGDADAQFKVGVMYYNGEGIPKNFAKAFEWCQKSAEQGNANAQYDLGVMYDNGDGVPKDYTKAFKWYQKAAEQGDADAQYSLALMYREGRGVPVDRVLSYAWLNLVATSATEKLSTYAKRERDRLELILSPAQRAEAQQLASSWKAGQLLRRSGGEWSGSISENGVPRRRGSGTGFVVNSGSQVLTNEHVIENCKMIKIAGLDGDVKIVTVDSVNDLALIQYAGEPRECARIVSDPSTVRQGEDIVVFGYPLYSVLSSGGNLTPGVVSALTGLANNTNQIQVTAPIQPGSSGSPVLNKKGNVVGLISMKLSEVETAKAAGSLPQNVNFAVSGQTIKSFLDQNNVPYKTNRWFSFGPKSAADLADEARKWTVIVECWR